VGDTLEAEIRIIVAPAPVLDNINRALHMSGLQGAKLCYSPLASAKAVLSRADAENGAVVIDIGDQMTHVGVFLRGALFHSAVIPVGGTHFTRDLEITKHLGGIPMAERIKRVNGTVLPSQTPPEEMIDLPDEGRQVSSREIAEVLHARGVELFNMALIEVGKSGVIQEIHGGVHLLGGGSLLVHMPILAQNIFGRPRVVLGKVFDINGPPQIIENPLYANALGAAKVLAEDLEDFTHRPTRSGIFAGFTGWVKGWF
jgi:cell division protein FtsA